MANMLLNVSRFYILTPIMNKWAQYPAEMEAYNKAISIARTYA